MNCILKGVSKAIDQKCLKIRDKNMLLQRNTNAKKFRQFCKLLELDAKKSKLEMNGATHITFR